MKVWFDFCEPKSVIYLRPLYTRIARDHDVLLTARDFDATIPLLDTWNVPYHLVGKYGGSELLDKLHSYVDRLGELLAIVEREKPDQFFSMASPEGMRITYGIKIPSIIFNDEPRSLGACSLTVPFADRVIVARIIPPEWYLRLGVDPARLVRFNGIDEIAWLNKNEFVPDAAPVRKAGLESDNYIVLRPEATQAYAHLQHRLKSHETLLTDVIPVINQHLKERGTDMKLLVLSRWTNACTLL